MGDNEEDGFMILLDEGLLNIYNLLRFEGDKVHIRKKLYFGNHCTQKFVYKI